MSKRESRQKSSGSYSPHHRLSSQNYDSCIQIHSPTSVPPKSLSPLSILHSTQAHSSNDERPKSANLLHPDSAKYPPGRLLSRNEDNSTPVLQTDVQKFATSHTTTLQTHRSWHKSKDSFTTQSSCQQRRVYIDEHTLAISVTIILALLIAIGLPLAALLPPKYVIPLPVNVLLPLYINPEQGGWDRLMESIIKHPDTNFTIILNPSNGPGAAAWPSGIYVTEIKKLNKLPNARTVGYIDTQSGQRANATVRKEIETYGGWNNSQIALSGIFFDHTPSQEWDDQVNGTAQEYLRNISATVKQFGGFQEPRTVIFNPGTIPNANFTAGLADVTVVFEGAYDEIPARDELKEEFARLRGPRESFAYWVYSVPHTIGRKGIRKVVDRTRRSVEWLFLSDQVGDAKYEGYSSEWEQFLDLIW